MDVLKATDQTVKPDLKDAVDSYHKTQVWNDEETGNENGWGAEDGAVEAAVPEPEWDWSDPAKQEATQEWQQQYAWRQTQKDAWTEDPWQKQDPWHAWQAKRKDSWAQAKDFQWSGRPQSSWSGGANRNLTRRS